MFVVDTNVLVYAADQDSPLHARCRKAVEQWRVQSSAWYVSWGVVYEFLRVTTHPQVMRRPWSAELAWGFVEALLASPALDVLVHTDRHAAAAAEVFKELPDLSGSVMHDVQTAVLMREHGIARICTFDTDFHRFPFLERFEPGG